ncbi:MAG: hypothetical protein VX681_14365 [Myxococcota bacterium]|nr:hypothetical protein [Myxococcota bacterium]
MTGLVYEIVPGAPRIAAGPDGSFGTDDDQVGPEIGDIDLVIRSLASFVGAIPPTAPRRAGGAIPTVVAGRLGVGTGIPFSLALTDGVLPLGPPVVLDDLSDLPMLVLAYADFDGDGYIGITQLDGDALDSDVEEAELVPIARRYAFLPQTTTSGELFAQAGGPPGAELDVVLSVVTWAGRRRPGFFSGAVPDGPALMTRLPFHPLTSVLDTLGDDPGPASAGSLVGAEVRPAFEPDPGDPAIGEAFTMLLDGSQPSTDRARIRSSEFVRFGLAVTPKADFFDDMPSRPLRPGFDDAGARVLYEILHQLSLPDDGSSSEATVRVVPLDAFGNIASLPIGETVELEASGSLEIRWPDRDGDVQRESLSIRDGRGADIVIDDSGGALDDADWGRLTVTSPSGIYFLDVSIPDPDVDDSGLVDFGDLMLIGALDGARVGEAEYDSRFDLDGNGRLQDDDLDEAASHLGAAVTIP